MVVKQWGLKVVDYLVRLLGNLRDRNVWDMLKNLVNDPIG